VTPFSSIFREKSLLTWQKICKRIKIKARPQNTWNFNMKNRPERIQSFLVILISFFLVVYPVYFQYNNLIEIDFFPPNPALENLDQEDQLGDEQNKTKIFILIFSAVISFFGFSWIGQLPRLSFHIFSLDQLISVLRC
jgi:hypothetical protein